MDNETLFGLNDFDKNFSERDLAYSAGLFDGEGYITIAKTGHSFQLRAGVNLTRGIGALEDLRQLFGGSNKPRANANYSQWKVFSAEAASFLKWILPYLKIKKEQAKLALEFYYQYKLLSDGAPKRLPLRAIEIGKEYKRQLAEYHSKGHGKGRPKRQAIALF